MMFNLIVAVLCAFLIPLHIYDGAYWKIAIDVMFVILNVAAFKSQIRDGERVR